MIHFFVLILPLFLGSCLTKKKHVELKINKKKYKFELAVTQEEKKRGLMFRKKLGKNGGMLFVYNYKSRLGFHMKNTLIPLDIAFLDENKKIVDIQKMEPLDETTIISKREAMYALEVNRGFLSRVGVKVGDELEFISSIPHIYDDVL